jgi:hypothetical protein
MPANQPLEDIEAIEDPLVKAYARAWERVTRMQQAIVDDPAKWRRQAKLNEARDAIVSSMEDLDVHTAQWLKQSFPQTYAMGAAAGSAEAGGPASMVWNQIASEAVEELAQDLFQDLLASTKNVRDSTKRMVREVMKDEALSKAIIGDTAKNAGKQAERLLASKGIRAITYKDGSSHGLAEYSQMAIRTKTGTAYNLGTLTGAESQGVRYWEVFDGPFCGWEFHDDSQALGRVVTKDEALSHPLSHPNCRRAFGARPDITNKSQAKDEQKRGGSTTTGQRDAIIEQDKERLDKQRRANNRQARTRRRQDAKSRPSNRQDKLNRRRERIGDLDMAPPSPMADLLMPPDAYAGLKSVSDLISEGWTPGDAAKEAKRLRANAASKLSKQKAKLKAAGGDTGDITPGAVKAPSGVPKSAKDIGTTAAGNKTLLQHTLAGLKVDTLEYIPAQNIGLGSSRFAYNMRAGIATRRDGITYLLEVKPGSVVGPSQIAKLEAAIKLQREALADAGFAKNVTKEVIISSARNPADAYWAKQYKRPGFKSAATGGDGRVTFWNANNGVTVGTLRHEAGHNFDYSIAKDAKLGSGSKEWAAAKIADADTSAAYDRMVEGSLGLTQHPATPGDFSVSAYGGAAVAEDFAEAFRLYLRDRADGLIGKMPNGSIVNGVFEKFGREVRFQDVWPERAKIFDKLTGNKPIQKAVKAVEPAKAIPAKLGYVEGRAEFNYTEARKSLPKNVQASIASKKSTTKAKALKAGKSADEATALGLQAEKDDIFKRWHAAKGKGGMTDGLKAAETATREAAEKAAKTAADFKKSQDDLAAFIKASKDAKDKLAKEIAAFNKQAAEDIARRAAADAKKAAEEAAKLAKADIGVISPEKLQVDVDAAKSFMEKTAGTQHIEDSLTAAPQAKKAAAKSLVDRLDNEADWNLFRDYKAAYGDKKVPEYSAISRADRLARLETEVTERISQWAASSGDGHMASVLMQMAVKEEFGLEGNALVMASQLQAQGIRPWHRKSGAWYRRFARVQYENTQAAFKADGVTHVYVHRGLGFKGDGPDWAQVGAHSPKFQPINSWSADLDTAESFARSADERKGSIGRVFSARVPVEHIIGTPRSGWGCLHEAEYVIMNGSGFAEVSKVGAIAKEAAVETAAKSKDALAVIQAKQHAGKAIWSDAKNLDKAGGIAAELGRQATIAPHTLKSLAKVTMMTDKQLIRNGATTTAVHVGDTIRLNTTMFKPGFAKSSAADIQAGWHVHGADNAVSHTIAHEFGHQIDNSMVRAGETTRGELLDFIAQELGMSKRPAGASGYGGIQQQKDSKIWTARNQAVLRSKVSRYGATNELEMLAEIWCEYSSAPNPRPHILVIGKRMQEMAEASAKKRNG